MKLNLALAQINTDLGNIQANLDRHLTLVKQACQDGMDLLVFPELSLTDYVLQDLVAAASYRPGSGDPPFQQLLDASYNIDLLVGFVDGDSRHRFFIGSAYLSQGKVVHIHHKVYLPRYGLFDEGCFFAAGDSVRAFDTCFGCMGMLICEDFWHASPPYILWQDRADLLFFPSASPGRGLTGESKLESSTWVEHINRAYASLFTIFIAHANHTGFEDGLNFWGGSTVFDPNGNLIAQAPYFEDTLTKTEIDLNQLHRTRARPPLLRDVRLELVQRELERILHGNKSFH